MLVASGAHLRRRDELSLDLDLDLDFDLDLPLMQFALSRLTVGGG